MAAISFSVFKLLLKPEFLPQLWWGVFVVFLFFLLNQLQIMSVLTFPLDVHYVLFIIFLCAFMGELHWRNSQKNREMSSISNQTNILWREFNKVRLVLAGSGKPEPANTKITGTITMVISTFSAKPGFLLSALHAHIKKGISCKYTFLFFFVQNAYSNQIWSNDDHQIVIKT